MSKPGPGSTSMTRPASIRARPTTKVSGRLMTGGSRRWTSSARWPTTAARDLRLTTEILADPAERSAEPPPRGAAARWRQGLRQYGSGCSPDRFLWSSSIGVRPRANLKERHQIDPAGVNHGRQSVAGDACRSTNPKPSEPAASSLRPVNSGPLLRGWWHIRRHPQNAPTRSGLAVFGSRRIWSPPVRSAAAQRRWAASSPRTSRMCRRRSALWRGPQRAAARASPVAALGPYRAPAAPVHVLRRQCGRRMDHRAAGRRPPRACEQLTPAGGGRLALHGSAHKWTVTYSWIEHPAWCSSRPKCVHAYALGR